MMKTEVSQGGKPQGIIGKIIGRMMNRFHIVNYKKIFDRLEIYENYNILDIGCGGGKFVHYISSRIGSGKSIGIDHSLEMVKLSEKVNAENIQKRKVEIIQGDVSDIQFESETFDIITALETIQFWPDIKVGLKEIYRCIKNDGRFVIINRFPKPGTKWYNIVQIKNENEYENILEQVGFTNIKIDIKELNGWIVVMAKKQASLSS